MPPPRRDINHIPLFQRHRKRILKYLIKEQWKLFRCRRGHLFLRKGRGFRHGGGGRTFGEGKDIDAGCVGHGLRGWERVHFGLEAGRGEPDCFTAYYLSWRRRRMV